MQIQPGPVRHLSSVYFHLLLLIQVSNKPNRVENAKKKVNKKDQETLDQKKKMRAQTTTQVEKRKAVEEAVGNLYKFLDEFHPELLTAKATKKEARKEFKYQKTILNNVKTAAAKQLDLLKRLKIDLDKVKDHLADKSHQGEALERMQTIQIKIKKENPVGRRGGAKRWPVHIVLLICELLVNDTHPSAVPANIQTTCAAFTSVEANELPYVNFVQCRVVLQNLNQTLSAFRLGNTDTWHQVFTEGTKPQHIAFQNLVIALMEEEGGKLDPVIISSCIYVENKTLERCVHSIIETVSW